MPSAIHAVETEIPEVLRAANSDTIHVHAEISPDLALSLLEPFVRAGYRIKWDKDNGIVITKREIKS